LLLAITFAATRHFHLPQGRPKTSSVVAYQRFYGKNKNRQFRVDLFYKLSASLTGVPTPFQLAASALIEGARHKKAILLNGWRLIAIAFSEPDCPDRPTLLTLMPTSPPNFSGYSPLYADRN
jgi:hypothetical protein